MDSGVNMRAAAWRLLAACCLGSVYIYSSVVYRAIWPYTHNTYMYIYYLVLLLVA